MELFAFGMLAGALLALIIIGGMNIAMDKREHDGSNSDNINCNNNDGNNRSMDRSTIEEKIENLVNRLRGMKVITGLCRTEKETLDEAADIIEVFIEGIK